MPRKVFQIKVEIHIQAVTCPGVWLCPNGKLSLQWYMLDSCVQTSDYDPVFPLLMHEKYLFCKILEDAHRLNDLQNILTKEYLYVELIQWKNCDVGYVLSSFHTSLGELLYPRTYEGGIAGVDTDLLMNPSKKFPGILAPKIEISTRTTIEEILCSKYHKKCSAYIINPKVIQSKHCSVRPSQMHQKKVCHSTAYHASRTGQPRVKVPKRPPFVLRKANEDLILRKPYETRDKPDENCRCRKEKPPTGSPRCNRFVKKSTVKKTPLCTCGHSHTEYDCPVCAKYKNYFNGYCMMTQQYVPKLKRNVPEIHSTRRSRDDLKLIECKPYAKQTSTDTDDTMSDMHQTEKSDTRMAFRRKKSQACQRPEVCSCSQVTETGNKNVSGAIHEKVNKTLGLVSQTLCNCRNGGETSSSDRSFEMFSCENKKCKCAQLRETLDSFYAKLYNKCR